MERRVVFQAINTVGLGHLSRLAAIATALRAQAPHTSIVFAVEGQEHGILTAAGFPSFSILGRENIGQARWSTWQANRAHALARNVASAVFDALEPHLVVFDLIPNPAFAWVARERAVPFVLCTRKSRWTDVFETYADARRFIVPHEAGEVAVPDEVLARTAFVGAIVRPTSARPSDAARPRIVITGGGGGFAGTVDFYNLALAAMERLAIDESDAPALLVAGPIFDAWARLRAVARVRVVPYEPDLSALFASADLVVCQAGYNTIAEVVALGVPAIVVPARRDLDDQHARAHAVAATSPQVHVFDGDDPTALAVEMERVLRAGHGTVRAVPPPPPGAARAAAVLLETLHEARP